MTSGTATRATSARIDPRLRDRRVSVQREQGRRRLRRLGYALGAVLAVVLVVVVLASPLFAVSEVQVRGVSRSTVGEVRSAAQLSGCAVAWCDTGAAQRRVEALPWVASARVTTSWPQGARIEVVERQAIAVVNIAPDRVAVIDVDGRVLEVGAPPAQAPRIEVRSAQAVGAPGSVIGPAAVAETLRALDGGLRDRVVAVVADPLAVVLDDGTEIRLGDTSALPAKLAAAVAVVQQLDAPAAYIDVRVPNAPAVGSRPTKR